MATARPIARPTVPNLLIVMKLVMLGLLFLWPFRMILEAQHTDPLRAGLDRFVENYMVFSRLGPGYAREITPKGLADFNGLFRSDASVCWDLYIREPDSIRMTVTPEEYSRLARAQFHDRQPVLSFPQRCVHVAMEGNTAVVSLKKIHTVMDPADRPLRRNTSRLDITVDLSEGKPVILRIARGEKRITTDRVGVGMNTILWSNLLHSLTKPGRTIPGKGERFDDARFLSRVLFQWSGFAAFTPRQSGDKRWSFSAGLLYSYTPVWTEVRGYEREYPDTVQSMHSRLACTTYERAPDVGETHEFTRMEVPVMVRWNGWDGFYLQAGMGAGWMTSTCTVHAILSRTGGGLVTDLETGEKVFLDRDHEIDASDFGYFRNRASRVSTGNNHRGFINLKIAPGYERRFGRFGVGLEPNLSVGTNPFPLKPTEEAYRVFPEAGFHPLIESVSLPSVEVAFGVRCLVFYTLN